MDFIDTSVLVASMVASAPHRDACSRIIDAH